MISILLELIGMLFWFMGARGRLIFSRVIAFIAFDILRVRRGLILKNLERVFGAESSISVRTKVGRESLSNFILTTIEFFCAKWIFKNFKFEFKNEAIMERALSQGRGVYAMVIHSGNFELLAYAFSKRFRQVCAPVKPVGRGGMARWVQQNRAAHGLDEVVNEEGTDRSRSARLTDELKQNGIVGFMVDQRRKKGLLVPFFGELAWTNSGLFYLWKTHPAPVIPVTIQRTGLWTQRICIHDELELVGVGELKFKEFVLENTKMMNQRVEALVAGNPSEYFWMHDRWKK
ncbi:MAG: hypothetical protein RJB13_691 [Pseudomonadota bacterium]